MKSGPRVVIELLGQPGSGKSTLLRALDGGELPPTSNYSSGWRRASLAEKAIVVAQVAFDGQCLAAAAQLVRRARLYNRDSLARLLRLLLKSQLLRSMTGTFLLQEGHLQDLWSILYSSGQVRPEPGLMAPLVRCLYRDCRVQIVLLGLSREATFERIRGRADGKSRLDRMSDEELMQALADTAQLPQILAEGAQLAGLSVARIDAALPVEVAADQLRSIIRKLNDRPDGE